MRNKLLILLLLIPIVSFSLIVKAELWHDLLNNNNIYMDLDSVKEINNKIRVRAYRNIENASALFYFEFDCNDESYRTLNETVCNKENLSGKCSPISDTDSIKIKYPRKNSIHDLLLQLNCSK